MLPAFSYPANDLPRPNAIGIHPKYGQTPAHDFSAGRILIHKAIPYADLSHRSRKIARSLFVFNVPICYRFRYILRATQRFACAAGRRGLKPGFAPDECPKSVTLTLVRQHGQHHAGLDGVLISQSTLLNYPYLDREESSFACLSTLHRCKRCHTCNMYEF